MHWSSRLLVLAALGALLAAGNAKATAGSTAPDGKAAPLTIEPTLTWNTFLGGSGYGDSRDFAGDWNSGIAVDASVSSVFTNPGLGGDWGSGIAMDASGNVYVTGNSYYTWGDPIRPMSYNRAAFVAKLDSDGTLLWNTFLGSGYGGEAITVDTSGNVYVTGNSGLDDTFVAKLDADGALLWNTFLGGNGSDYGNGIAVDASGNVYVTGASDAAWGDPLRPWVGEYDAFVAKLDTDGALLWNTFLGGIGSDDGNVISGDSGNAIAVDATGNLYVTGNSSSTWGVPIRKFKDDAAFVAKLDSDGALLWNTFLGAKDTSAYGYGIAVDANGSVFVTGSSWGAWGVPIQAYAGNYDAFVANLDTNGTLLWNSFLGAGWPDEYNQGNDQGYGIAVDASGNLYVTGSSDLTWGDPIRPISGQDAFVACIPYDIAWPTLTITASDPTATEAGTPPGQFTVTRTGSTAAALMAYFAIGGTAIPGSDYVPRTGSVTIGAGSSTATIKVKPLNDTEKERRETVVATLSAGSGYKLGNPASATVTIDSDDMPPKVRFSLAASSGAESTTPAVINVILSKASSRTVTVKYATSDGRATAVGDYAATSGILTFDPGVKSQSINVAVTDDTVVEANENFTVTLKAPVNARLGTPSRHVYSIKNDDVAPSRR